MVLLPLFSGVADEEGNHDKVDVGNDEDDVLLLVGTVGEGEELEELDEVKFILWGVNAGEELLNEEVILSTLASDEMHILPSAYSAISKKVKKTRT